MSNGAVKVKWNTKNKCVVHNFIVRKHENGKVNITFAVGRMWGGYMSKIGSFVYCWRIFWYSVLQPAAGRHIVPRLLTHLTDQQIVQKAENFSSKFFRNCWESSICIVVCQVCLIFWPLLTPRARRKSGGNGGNFSPVCAGFGKRQRAPVFSPNEQCPKLGSACSKVSLGRIFETLLEKPPTPVNNLWPKRGGCDKKWEEKKQSNPLFKG